MLPLYAERFGASGLTVGLLFASFSLAQFVCAPLLGRLSDRIGRKPVHLLSLFGTALGSFITAAAGSLFVLFIGRVLDGASGASVSVAQGTVADMAEPADRPRLLGMLGAAFGVGFVVGPAIGSLAALGGTRLPFIVAGGIALVNGLVAIVRLPETRPSDARTAVPAHEPVSHPRSAVLVRLALVGFLATCAFSGFEATFSLFADRRFGLTEAGVAAVFVGIGVVLVAVQGGIVGRVSVRLGPSRTLRSALAANLVGMVLLALATSWWVLVPALACLTVGQGLAIPSLTAMVVDRAPGDRRGEALGFQQSASALAAHRRPGARRCAVRTCRRAVALRGRGRAPRCGTGRGGSRRAGRREPRGLAKWLPASNLIRSGRVRPIVLPERHGRAQGVPHGRVLADPQ